MIVHRVVGQATRYGAELLSGHVSSCKRDGDIFAVQASIGSFRARAVLLAAGVDVVAPNMSDLDVAIARGLLRYCPICDGYEATGARIGVVGHRQGSIDEAHFLRTYSDDVTYVPMHGGSELTHDQIDRAAQAGIAIERQSCVRLAINGDALELTLASGERLAFEVVYPCLGSNPRSALAEALGARLSDQAELITDAHQATNVAGLYAAGDVLRGLDQVASACGQAAIAATAIHNHLRECDWP